MLVQKESDAGRSGATDKSLDALVGRRLETRRARRIWPNSFAVRLDRNTATPGAGRLDLGPNSPRQNDPDITYGALANR
ncbi:MAG: hypothetical protein H6875_00225 [Hyphomicrobiaceae bacterium]|nr:hypothetical protein [Hyphomicrobiaceae bacterium]